MSLQRKFIILLGLLGVTVLGGLGVTIWTFVTQHQALAGPFADAPKFLRSIEGINRQLEGMRVCVGATESPEVFIDSVPHEVREKWPVARPERSEIRGLAHEEFERRWGMISVTLKEMSESDLFISAGPGSAIKSMSQRLETMKEKGRGWFISGDEAAREEIGAAADRIAERAATIRMQVLEDRGMGIDFSNAIVGKLVTLLISSAGASLLFGMLALVLLHRWVLRPVRELRAAAAAIASGRFEHQIPVNGSDEIAQLSMEVNHMASTIRTMLDERVEQERLAALGEMVRRLAHSLRNPLSGIRSLAEVTRDELPADSELREHQNRILKAVDRFEQWLSDLLNSTKPLQLQVATTNTREFVAHVVDSHRAMAEAKHVRLEVRVSEGMPGTVQCDSAQLEHAVVSVLTNAIQASPMDGRVVFAVDRVGEAWEMSISDEGPGIPEEVREKAFVPYFTTKPSGTGIGLAIANQVVRSHGGSIRIEPDRQRAEDHERRNGPGCMFVIRVPLEPKSNEREPGASAAAYGGTGASRAERTDHRGRGEPAVLDPANAGSVGVVRR